MERPKKYFAHELHPGTPVFKFGSINPLLDELEAYKQIIPDPYATIGGGRIVTNKKPFPSPEEFEEWYLSHKHKTTIIHAMIFDYFAQFQYERVVYPKVGDMVEGLHDHSLWVKGELNRMLVQKEGAERPFTVTEIRPVTRPTREELIEMYKIKPEHLELLKG